MSVFLFPHEINNEHGEAIAIGQKVAVKHSSGLVTTETVTGIFGVENDWSIQYFWAGLNTAWRRLSMAAFASLPSQDHWNIERMEP